MWQAVDSHRDRTIELGQTASRAAGIRLAGQLADHQTPGQTELERLADAAMAHTERTRATWTLSNIRAEAERLLADIRLDPTARADTANQVAELAIRRCVKITPTRYRAGQAGDDPALVSRAGRSTFDDPTLDRYTSQTILDMEKRVMATFGRTDPLAWGPGEGTRLIQAMRAGGNRLSDDQAKAAAYLLENPHAASALIGPAGTGKTTTMRAVARAWETRHGRGSVLGLTLSVRARDELADSIGTNAITIAKLLGNVSGRHRAQADELRREYRCRLAAARTPAERDRIPRAACSPGPNGNTGARPSPACGVSAATPGSGRTTPTADGPDGQARATPRCACAPAATARNRTASRHAAGSSPNTRPTTVSTGARTGNARRRRTG